MTLVELSHPTAAGLLSSLTASNSGAGGVRPAIIIRQ